MAVAPELPVDTTDSSSTDLTIATNQEANTIIAHGGNGSVEIQVKLSSGAYETVAVIRGNIMREKMHYLQGPVTYRLHRVAGTAVGADVYSE
jgi:hypothetical protein